jgi:hypothetical protein
MKEAAELINEMLEDGIVENYAIFGAVAQMRYTEAVSALGADVLVALPDESSLDLLGPIFRYCAKKGYKPEGEAIRVGEWPVQFIPAFDEITQAALEHAETTDLDDVKVRVVPAVYLAVIALSVGRMKDFMRVLALLEAGATSQTEIEALSGQFELSPQWDRFKQRFIDDESP